MEMFLKSATALVAGLYALGASAQIAFTPNTTLLQGSYGSPACVVDMNGDHLDDVVRMNGSVMTIDHQQVDGSFIHSDYISTNVTSVWSICAGDLNNDGFNDVLLGDGNHVEFLYAINGGTNYQQSYVPDYIFCQRSTMNDIDKDGWLDAFVCHDVDQSHPFRNDGTGNLVEDQTLVPTGSNPEGGNYAAVWVDYDNDGDQDLYITKCRGGAAIDDERRINQMYRNDGGVFTESAGTIGLRDSAQSWSTVFEDFDNDGDFDAFIVNHTDKNRFLENDGAGNFTDIISSTGIDANDLGAWESQAADFDNDGFIDIFSEVGGGIYRNNGNMTFTNINIAPDEGGIGDLNNDGWLDYQLGGTAYLNNGGSNHWIKIELDGITSAQNGIGSRIEIYGAWGVQTREIRSGQGFSHMNFLQGHFGLGAETSIDSLVVTWPSGTVTTIPNPPIDQLSIVPEVECLLPSFNIVASGATSFCPGGSVELSAPNGYTSYQWSNGESTQTITVVAGANYTCLGYNAIGCAAMSDQISVSVLQEAAPSISFAGDLEICDGSSTQLTAVGSTLPLIWNTTATANTITVSTAGDYWIIATGQCGTYYSDTVTVSVLAAAADPVTTDAQIPAPGTGILNATGTHVWWYDQQNAPDSIGSGNVWETPAVTQTTTFWAESNEEYSVSDQMGGKSSSWSGGGITAAIGYCHFNVSHGFTIQSVMVYALAPGMRTIQLVNDQGTILASTQVNLAVGVYPISLGFHVDPGTDYSLRCAENDLFRHNAGVQYPYAIGSVGEITGSINGSAYYYFFYDWVVTPDSKFCPSQRVPAVVDIVNGVAEQEHGVQFAVYPNPSDDMLNIDLSAPFDIEELSVIDLSGRTILSQQPGKVQGVLSLDISGLSSGTYTISLRSEQGETKQVFIVQR